MADQPDARSSVALLGTGIMGAAMGRNMLRAGLPLRAWNRTIARALTLEPDGAQVAQTPAEAIALARGLGIDPQLFIDTVAGGPLDSPYLRTKASAIMKGDFSPSFTAEMAAKDGRLIVAAASQAGIRLDVAAAAAERLRRAVELGHARADMAANYFASFDDR